VTWKSESTSRRKASNSSSARSISSMRSTGGLPEWAIACKRGRFKRNGSLKISASVAWEASFSCRRMWRSWRA
jgi:hypothetical protein